MNFYVGNSLKQLKKNVDNIQLEDEMVEYLYSKKNLIPFVSFFGFDPYADSIMEKEDIKDIISMCEYVLKEQLLNDYDEIDEINLAVIELKKLGYSALEKGEKILIIGD